MKKSTYIASTVVVLLVIATEITAKVSVSTRSQHFPGQKFGYSTNSLKNDRLIYTICDNGDVQRKCKVLQEDIISGNFTYSCDIILKIEEGMKFGLFLEVAFGKDKAVLIWEEKKNFKMYVRFTTIQLTDCKVGEAKLLDDNESLEREPIHHQLYISQKIITYDSKYDVFFEDETTCGKQECKFSIDAEGKIINKPTPFVNNSPYHIRMLKLISKNESLEVFASLMMNKNGAILTLIKSAVSEKPMITIGSDRNEILSHSVEHERVGVCIRSKKESKLTCYQYDVNGNPKSEVNLPDIETHMSPMYVLPDGGFLFLTLKVEFCQPTDENCEKYPVSSHYLITKVEPTGKTKELNFEGFNKTRIGKYAEFIYENPNGNGHCATVVYSKYDSTNNIMNRKVEDRNVITNCFTDDDFTE